MGNWDISEARRFHETTKHTFESVRASARALDWENRPSPFKEYLGLEPLSLPDPEAGALGWLLRLGAGVRRSRTSAGGVTHHFRTYASAGALYPVEVYLACADLPGLAAGLYHFHPGELALRQLRRGDLRSALAAAADAPALAEAGAVLLLTGILWRTAWKYGARGYRHLFWDAGTMLANLISLASAAQLRARLLAGFVDAEVNLLLGIDGEREAALALLSVGSAEAARERPRLEPLELEVAPLSAHELAHPEAYALHAGSSLASAEEVRRFRAAAARGETTGTPELPRDALERALRRRGSLRDFSPEGVPASELAAIVARAVAPPSTDALAGNETYVIAHALDGLAPGVYRFAPPDGFALQQEGNFRAQAGYLVLEQPLGALSAGTLFFLVDLDRVLEGLGNRGYRVAELEAGIAAGRVYLGAYAEGLGATASTFYDDEVTKFLAPGTEKSPMLCVAVGRKVRRA